MISTAIVAIACLAALVLHDRQSQARIQAERADWRDERRELLNRIKPETAQYVAPANTQEPVQPRWDDDEGYWNARAESMSTEELAEALMEQDRKMAEATS